MTQEQQQWNAMHPPRRKLVVPLRDAKTGETKQWLVGEKFFLSLTEQVRGSGFDIGDCNFTLTAAGNIEVRPRGPKKE